MRSKLMTLAALAALSVPAAYAAGDHHHGGGHMQHTAASAEQAIQGTGTIKAVNDSTVTLAHEAIQAIKWPAMTMEFPLQDPALAKGLKSGDRVEFQLKPSGNQYVITAIQAKRD